MSIRRERAEGAGWLDRYLKEAIRRGLCTRIGCTTCGAQDVRRGVLSQLSSLNSGWSLYGLNGQAAIELAKQLTLVRPDGTDEGRLKEVVRLVLYDLWVGRGGSTAEIEPILEGTWAGGVLADMKVHYRAQERARCDRADFESPAPVQQHQEERSRRKQGGIS